jgi:hypothetical protein
MARRNGSSFAAGPTVRISFPPAASRLRTCVAMRSQMVERRLKRRRYSRFARRGCTIEGCRRETEAVRDLGDADIRIGEQCFGGLDVVVREFRRTPSLAAEATGGGEARLGALPDRASLEFRECPKHVKDQPPLCGRWSIAPCMVLISHLRLGLFWHCSADPVYRTGPSMSLPNSIGRVALRARRSLVTSTAKDCATTPSLNRGIRPTPRADPMAVAVRTI